MTCLAVLAAMRRHARNGWRTNVAQGGKAEAIRTRKDLEQYERIFADAAFWKKLGEEYENPLIIEKSGGGYLYFSLAPTGADAAPGRGVRDQRFSQARTTPAPSGGTTIASSASSLTVDDRTASIASPGAAAAPGSAPSRRR